MLISDMRKACVLPVSSSLLQLLFKWTSNRTFREQISAWPIGCQMPSRIFEGRRDHIGVAITTTEKDVKNLNVRPHCDIIEHVFMESVQIWGDVGTLSPEIMNTVMRRHSVTHRKHLISSSTNYIAWPCSASCNSSITYVLEAHVRYKHWYHQMSDHKVEG